MLPPAVPSTPTGCNPGAGPEQRFDTLERRYVIFILERFPVVSTYLGGSEFDATPRGQRWQAARLFGGGAEDEDVRWVSSVSSSRPPSPTRCRRAAGSNRSVRWRRSRSC